MRRSVTHNLLAHNGPAGFHDLMHGMSPVHVKSPFLVPTQSKSIGTKHLLDSSLGATDARYWDRRARVLGPKLKKLPQATFRLSFPARAPQYGPCSERPH